VAKSKRDVRMGRGNTVRPSRISFEQGKEDRKCIGRSPDPDGLEGTLTEALQNNWRRSREVLLMKTPNRRKKKGLAETTPLSREFQEDWIKKLTQTFQPSQRRKERSVRGTKESR